MRDAFDTGTVREYMVRHFLGQSDLSTSEIEAIFVRTEELKLQRMCDTMAGRSLVMFFEKSSTRTRLSFEIGMTQMGGHAVYVDPSTSQLSRGESMEDTARVVSRYADVIMARVQSHATVTKMAEYSSIPVINGLSDREHPCQSMADLFSIREAKGGVDGITIAFIGDGNNNVTHSLMIGATQLGAHIIVATPSAYRPEEEFVQSARENGNASGGSVRLTEDPFEAVSKADIIYADVWVSMGHEDDGTARLRDLQAYQVNAALVAHAPHDYLFMHCLPAHIGQEVTADVAYGSNSIMFDQAENRLHVQKAIIEHLVQSK